MKETPANPLSMLGSALPRGPAQELERRWRQQGPVALEEFLAEGKAASDGQLAAEELTRLILIDQRGRWPRQQRVLAEDYLARFPQLKADEELALDVIYAEFLLREELGETPSAEEYTQRFPDWAETLRDQIEFHLAMDRSGAHLLDLQADQPTERSGGTLHVHRVRPARLPQRLVPGYEIERELGRGGMGVVYQARQLSLNRRVALKMLRSADCSSPAQLARFQAEAEAVARLHHPHIVQIYDYGEHDGWPYLALELVEGGPLAARLNGKPLPPRAAAEIIAKLARTIHFAHEQGIIHRDLKPGNILLGSGDHEAPERWAVKITDFGLAKVFRDSAESHTHTGTIVGTPSYMAPEQASGQAATVSAATDVYALGAMLYELLSSQPPFKESTPLETLHRVLNQEAAPVNRRVPGTPRDLVTIVAKCLQKEPLRRYASAADLASDLERFLADRPILARRTSLPERSWRWCRRNPVVSLLTGSVAALLVAVAVVSQLSSWRLSRQLGIITSSQQREEEARELAEVRLWESYLAQIDAGRGSRRVGQRAAALATAERANELLTSIGRTPERALRLRNATISVLALPDLREVSSMPLQPGHSQASVSLTADRYVAARSGAITVHRLSSGELVCEFPSQIDNTNNATALTISPAGDICSAIDERGARFWRCTASRPELICTQPGASFTTFSPRGEEAAVPLHAGGLVLIDLRTGAVRWRAAMGIASSAAVFHEPSRKIAVCAKEGLRIVDWDSGKLTDEPAGESKHGVGVAWHPSGTAVAISGLNDGVALWDVSTGSVLTYFEHRGYIPRPRFSHDGQFLLTVDEWSKNMRVWNVGTGHEVLHEGGVQILSMAVSPQGADQLVEQRGETVLVRELTPGLVTYPLIRAKYASLGDVRGADISPDGELLAIARTKGLDVWSLRGGHQAASAAAPVYGLEFGPTGDLFVAYQRGLYRWPCRYSSAAEGPDHCQVGPPQRLTAALAGLHLGVSKSSGLVVARTQRGYQCLGPKGSTFLENAGPDDDPRLLDVSPDGKWVSIGNWNQNGVNIWDVATSKRLLELPTGHAGKPIFSLDGRWLATTPEGVRLWHVGTWKPGAFVRAQGSSPSGMGIAFSPDSRVLAVGQTEQVTRLVDPETGRDWAQLLRPDADNSSHLVFTPNQSQLIEIPIGDRGSPRFWNLAALRQKLAKMNLDWPQEVLAVTTSREAGAHPPLQVVIDEGHLPNWKAADEAIASAGLTKDARAKELLERVIALEPDNAYAHNVLAWLLATGPESLRDAKRAVTLAQRCVELDPTVATSWNTLGVALYRDGQFSLAAAALQESLNRGGEESAGFDLIFLALVQLALDDRSLADDYFHQADTWLASRRGRLPKLWQEELDSFFAEAAAVGLFSQVE